VALDQNGGASLSTSKLTGNCEAHYAGTDHLHAAYRLIELAVWGSRPECTACVKSARCELEVEKRRALALVAQKVENNVKDMLWWC
jgi:hypothetical protein